MHISRTLVELGLLRVAAVVLDDVDGLDGVLVARLHELDGLDHHLGVELVLGADDLGAHGGLGAVHEAVGAQVLDLHAEVLGDVAASLLAGDLVAAHDAGRVQLLLDELVGALQQLRGDDHHGGRAVAHLLVLQLRQLHDHLRRRVLHV